MKKIGKAIYDERVEFDVKADCQTGEIVQMSMDGVHESIRWEASFEDEAEAKENAKTIIESSQNMKFQPK